MMLNFNSFCFLISVGVVRSYLKFNIILFALVAFHFEDRNHTPISNHLNPVVDNN